MKAQLDSTRGLTLVETVVVMVVLGIIGLPIGLTMVNMTRAEKRLLDELKAARALTLLEVNLRGSMSRAAADLTNDNQDLLRITRPSGPNTGVVLHYLVNPEQPGTIADMARYSYIQAERTIVFEDLVNDRTQVLVTDVVACRFNLGPGRTQGEGYAGFEHDNPALLLVEVAVEIDNARFEKTIVMRAPNAMGYR